MRYGSAVPIRGYGIIADLEPHVSCLARASQGSDKGKSRSIIKKKISPRSINKSIITECKRRCAMKVEKQHEKEKKLKHACRYPFPFPSPFSEPNTKLPLVSSFPDQFLPRKPAPLTQFLPISLISVGVVRRRYLATVSGLSINKGLNELLKIKDQSSHFPAQLSALPSATISCCPRSAPTRRTSFWLDYFPENSKNVLNNYFCRT